MGIDIYSLDFLMRFYGSDLGHVLMLGRQGLHVQKGDPFVSHVLEKHGAREQISELCGADGYCEPLFRVLGATEISSMDYSKYEGANLVCDLNRPVDERFRGKFDTIFDGGTLEHIYDFPLAIANVKAMLKVGGLFLASTTANNFLGHGFYQFSPELMWRVFGEHSGFSVISMSLCQANGIPELVDAPDPARLNQRSEIMVTLHPTYLFVAARKVAEASASMTLQQSDYEATWRQFQ